MYPINNKIKLKLKSFKITEVSCSDIFSCKYLTRYDDMTTTAVSVVVVVVADVADVADVASIPS